MNEEILNNILSEDNFDKLQNIINDIEDKEELMELYNEVKDKLQNKVDLYKKKEISFFDSIKNIFRDKEKKELQISADAAEILVKKIYSFVRDEMFEYIKSFLPKRSEIASNTINFFIYYLSEIKNHHIDIDSYKKCIEYLNDTDEQIYLYKILNMKNVKELKNFNEFEKLEQNMPAKLEKSVVKSLGHMAACGVNLAQGFDNPAAIFSALGQAKEFFKDSDDDDRSENIDIINALFKNIELYEKVISDFEKIINTIQDLTEKIEKLDEEISDLDEYFVPIIADYDEKDVYCVQIFNKYSGLISSMHTLLMTEIL